MKFHALTVRNFKGITETTVDFPDTGVIIIEGPNEAGKSSLIEAIDLLFRYKDSSSHKAITEAHPIGEDESPYVEIEASIGPYRFSYAKRWAKRGANGARGRGGKTTLHITTPRTENHSGVAAHERATEILEEHVDTALWDALRLLQGTELAPLCLEGSTQLRAALDAASGAGTDAGGDGDTILAAVESEYTRYFTPLHWAPQRRIRKSACTCSSCSRTAGCSSTRGRGSLPGCQAACEHQRQHRRFTRKSSGGRKPGTAMGNAAGTS
ncbi:AAA family ATPase [Dermatophilus congolensis]|uniref:AAA family ATPase n=1 Tax=Dermatophilus congolensis TaxID=1863 RepID=UPI000E0E1FCE|nr:ATP-binding protein [Dermatophilus congolensis]